MSDITWKEWAGKSEPIFGDYNTADIVVEVVTNHLERYVTVECLCGACHEIANVGLDEATDATTEPLADGVHYFEHYVEEHRHPEGSEWSSGLRYATKETTE